MTDDHVHNSTPDEELLSAYLAGELDDAVAAAFERRLAQEPQLAARADALADALVGLSGADAAVPSEQFEQRLQQRIADERRSAPTDLTHHRERRNRRSVWLGVGTAAAVLAAGALMAGNVIRGVGSDSGSVTAGLEESAGDAGGEAADAGQGSGIVESGPDAPVILDRNVAVADEQALRRRYADIPEAQGLLGTELDDARELARQFSSAVSDRGEDFSSKDMAVTSGATGGGGGGASKDEAPAPEPAPAEGAEAAPPDLDEANSRRAGGATDPCLDTITESTETPLVPVRVETLRYAGKRALAYVFVTASPGSSTLDRTEVWVVRPRDCATLIFQQY